MFSFVVYDKFGIVKASSPTKTLRSNSLRFAKYSKFGELMVTGGGGGGATVTSGTFNIDFGTGDSYVTTTVSDTNINGTSDLITFVPNSRAEDFAVEDIQLTVTASVAATSFTVAAYAPNTSNGIYSIKYTLIN